MWKSMRVVLQADGYAGFNKLYEKGRILEGCPAPLALLKLFRDQAERGSGIGLDPFGFIAESARRRQAARKRNISGDRPI